MGTGSSKNKSQVQPAGENTKNTKNKDEGKKKALTPNKAAEKKAEKVAPVDTKSSAKAKEAEAAESAPSTATTDDAPVSKKKLPPLRNNVSSSSTTDASDKADANPGQQPDDDGIYDDDGGEDSGTSTSVTSMTHPLRFRVRF